MLINILEKSYPHVLFSIFELMSLSTYISDLLYRYECVIVPEFGGFVTNKTSAKLNSFTHTFYPPSKQITFNRHLKNNDGLLANYIASVEMIPFSDAIEIIKKEVSNWNHSLKYETIELSKIGSLSLNSDGKLLFDPITSENYLTSSFGLSTYHSPAVKREVYLEKVKALETSKISEPTQTVKRRKTPVFLKYAASIALTFAIGSVAWNTYNENQYQQQLLAEQHQQIALEQKIQEATFIIENPLPAITLNVTKEVRNYHIIAGAFREAHNAVKKVQQLGKIGFDAQILGVNKWGLTQVAYASFETKLEALKSLREIKNNTAKDAWLLVQEF